mmetsp:Transcript_18267/g.58191  ORF Transcript_18267/g.58191 Transcript_18267/m.58191 type:complete len:263 (-) Transcript_18267:941-1729(-)
MHLHASRPSPPWHSSPVAWSFTTLLAKKKRPNVGALVSENSLSPNRAHDDGPSWNASLSCTLEQSTSLTASVSSTDRVCDTAGWPFPPTLPSSIDAVSCGASFVGATTASTVPLADSSTLRGSAPSAAWNRNRAGPPYSFSAVAPKLSAPNSSPISTSSPSSSRSPATSPATVVTSVAFEPRKKLSSAPSPNTAPSKSYTDGASSPRSRAAISSSLAPGARITSFAGTGRLFGSLAAKLAAISSSERARLYSAARKISPCQE